MCDTLSKGPGMNGNKAGVVSLSELSRATGWTAYQVRRQVARGMPVAQVPATRGGDWRFRLSEVLAWADAQGVARKAPAPPPGWEALDGLENPVDRGFALAQLTAGYELPRLLAVLAVDQGLPIGASWRLANLAMAALDNILTGAARKYGIEPCGTGEFLPLDEGDRDGESYADLSHYRDDCFVAVDWPSLAAKAGEPGWTPPAYGGAWPELSAERRG